MTGTSMKARNNSVNRVRTEISYDDYLKTDPNMGNWDAFHHISPSKDNRWTHTYFKQFFDKPSKRVQNHIIKYKKTLDPYLQNEYKNRIPVYSTVYNVKTREKELDWIDNFCVKRSKDNNKIHSKFKEFFDQPKQYEYDRTVGKTRGIVKHSIAHRNKVNNFKTTAFTLAKNNKSCAKDL